jgi:hypothetical protein
VLAALEEEHVAETGEQAGVEHGEAEEVGEGEEDRRPTPAIPLPAAEEASVEEEAAECRLAGLSAMVSLEASMRTL